MIPGLSIETLLTVHVAVSLIGIATGLVAMPALAAGRWLGGWQAAFLITTALTSVTGFLFPFSGVTPAFLFGVISMVALAVTAAAWPFRAQRAAGIAYAVAATLALYLNLFVLIVQSFQKVPAGADAERAAFRDRPDRAADRGARCRHPCGAGHATPGA